MQYSGIKNKVAIITGAGEGIGYAIVELLLKAGANVVLNDVDEEKSKRAATKLDVLYDGSCLSFHGDSGDITTINNLVAFTIEQFGKVDFVIPNAAITIFGSFLETSTEGFQKTLQLNLHGAYFLVQRAAKEMIKQKSGGKVVLISSQVGIRAYKNLTAYAMTKAALRMMAVNLAYELGEHSINLNVVAPGATLTERTADEQPDYSGMWGQLNPNGRVGTPEDIAKTCLFLLSDDASHINGQTIPVDGGWTTAGKYPEDL
ncbi:SDR family oxidoreductase [Aurantibacter crassamenti]|uniref:SDR family NAD(P)-dependent oxidoreductase n=1 Tax=Aurantibacter crassamenti TaxID=1837375 RepID=UPI001939F7CD|nr:SDR family oxidoreductase [Aurantibacter crassamenti]MBM1105200.1 SDR family oxidoreductase [Aurantibacter crassamenti]